MKYVLKDIANVIRSKNAGPFELTLDVMLKDQEMFEAMRAANVINTKLIAKLYQIPEEDVISIVYFPNAKAIKATISLSITLPERTITTITSAGIFARLIRPSLKNALLASSK